MFIVHDCFFLLVFEDNKPIFNSDTFLNDIDKGEEPISNATNDKILNQSNFLKVIFDKYIYIFFF